MKVVHDGFSDGGEHCCFCHRITHFWYEPKDVAVCPSCAATRLVRNVPNKEDWCASVRHLTYRVAGLPHEYRDE